MCEIYYVSNTRTTSVSYLWYIFVVNLGEISRIVPFSIPLRIGQHSSIFLKFHTITLFLKSSNDYNFFLPSLASLSISAQRFDALKITTGNNLSIYEARFFFLQNLVHSAHSNIYEDYHGICSRVSHSKRRKIMIR